MNASNHDDPLDAVVLQLGAHTEQIDQLSQRADTTGLRLDAMTTILGPHASAVNALDGLDDQVASLSNQITDLATAHAAARSQGYAPQPAPRWWQLTGSARDEAIDRLRAWVEQIYRPGYEHLAATLPACWELHPLCLYTLDWLSELWSALYLDVERVATTLGAQAEWQSRLLPAAADQMAQAATGCHHNPGGFHRPGSPSAPPPGRGHAPRPR